MIEIGKSLPNLTEPAETTGAAEMLALKGVCPCSSADHAGPRYARIPQEVGTGFATRIRATQKTLAFSCQKMLSDQPFNPGISGLHGPLFYR
jgi:hypothetical protein